MGLGAKPLVIVMNQLWSIVSFLSIEEHLACKKLIGEVLLAWLSVRSEVQMISVWSSSCHCHSIISWFTKIQVGLTVLLPLNPG